MEIHVVIPIKLLEWDPSDEFNFDGFTVTNNYEKKMAFVKSETFLYEFGLLYSRHILENPIICFKGDSEKLPLTKGCASLFAIGSRIADYLPRFVDCFWFLRDNSCYINELFFESVNDKRVFLRTSGYSASTFRGSYSSTKFVIKDLKIVHAIFLTIVSLTTLPSKVPPDLYDSSENLSPDNHHKHRYDLNRITTAVNLYLKGRSDTSLVVKITFFVAVFEALFSTKRSTPYSRKVPERVASFIAKNDTDLETCYRCVHTAYGIRSDYIHGSAVNVSVVELIDILCTLDYTLRVTLAKVIASHHIFMPEGKDKFGHHFTSLVSKNKDLFAKFENTKRD
jgi:hypothetical protein